MVAPRAAPPLALVARTVAANPRTCSLRTDASPTAFADQLDNLAGPAFAASLFPYLAFLFFLNQPRNRLADTAKTGFTTLLVFVAATVVASILATKGFNSKLADVDWLHADAEQLLTLTNVLEVVGLKATLDAFIQGKDEPDSPKIPLLPIVAAVAAGTAAVTYATAGGSLDGHTPFLGGLGDLPPDILPFTFVEPPNALSIPTWVVHVSSLLEWLVAMGLVWRIGDASGNPRWKGLTWAMIPSHSSGICACVYHFFYNAPSVGYVVLLQALLTFVGNSPLAFATYRLAVSNGWSAADLRQFLPGQKSEPAQEAVISGLSGDTAKLDFTPTEVASEYSSGALMTIFAWSVGASYLIKYGETLIPITTDANVAPYAAAFMIIAPTAFNAWKWSERAKADTQFRGII